MDKFKLDMLRAYIRGALSIETAPDDRYMQGYDAGIRAIRDYLDKMERPIEEEAEVEVD